MILRRYCALLILFFFITAAPLSAAVYCFYCGGAIHGTYHTDGTRKVCPSCYEIRKPHCSVCGANIEDAYYRVQDQTLCENCRSKAQPHCNGCGTVLQKTYYHPPQHGHIRYCETCYENGTMAKDGKQGYPVRSPEDFRLTDKYCCICGRQLAAADNHSALTNSYFCRDCQSAHPACRSCGAPAPSARQKDAGFPLCGLCGSIGVESASQLEEIFTMVLNDASEFAKISVPIGTNRIHMVSSGDLKNLWMSVNGELPGELCAMTVKTDGRYEIFIQKGMPYDMFYQMLCSQYARLWLLENGPQNQSEALKDAFGNWVALKGLYARDYGKRARALETGPQGDDIRLLDRLEERIGGSGVTQYVKVNRELPR